MINLTILGENTYVHYKPDEKFKRQGTVWKKNSEIYVINVNDQDSTPEYIKNFYKGEQFHRIIS